MNKNVNAFKGHMGHENYDKDGIKSLRHETFFFRDFETKKFVRDYIKQNFLNKEKINIIAGACSTGEEAVTLSMMLDDIKDKVNITGVDLGEKAIEQAKSRKYLIQKGTVYGNLAKQIFNKYKDSYLWYESDLPLLPEEKEQKLIFKKFFTPVRNQSEANETLIDYKSRAERLFVGNIQSKILKLKNGMAENCQFLKDNIMNLKNICKDKKADVIFFSNALYHLTTTDTKDERIPKENAPLIMKQLAQVFCDNLNTGGIVCFGENEQDQGIDIKLLKSIMKSQGFETIKIPKRNLYMLPLHLQKYNPDNYTENVFRKIG